MSKLKEIYKWIAKLPISPDSGKIQYVVSKEAMKELLSLIEKHCIPISEVEEILDMEERTHRASGAFNYYHFRSRLGLNKTNIKEEVE